LSSSIEPRQKTEAGFSITPRIAATSWNKRLDWPENRGYRAEVRRERKKRDNLSPVNVR